MRASTLILLAAAAGATHAQTIQQRAAEVLNTLAPPATVETVIDRGTTVIGRPMNPAAASPQATPAQAPTLSIQPIQTSSDAGGGEPTAIDARGTAFVDDPRGTAFMNDVQGIGLTGLPPWLPNAKAPAVPGLVTISPRGRSVRGASNLVTVPRSASPSGDSNP